MLKGLENFKRKNTESFYIPQYIKFYIEYKKKITGKSHGEIIEESILKNSDFKKVLNDFFESSKL